MVVGPVYNAWNPLAGLCSRAFGKKKKKMQTQNVLLSSKSKRYLKTKNTDKIGSCSKLFQLASNNLSVPPLEINIGK